MSLITEYAVKTTPARRIVEIYDADAYLDDERAFTAARQEVVAGNGYHLYLHSLQQDIKVHVAIRIWDAPRTPPPAAEGHVPITLESETGILVINQLAFGPAGEIQR